MTPLSKYVCLKSLMHISRLSPCSELQFLLQGLLSSGQSISVQAIPYVASVDSSVVSSQVVSVPSHAVDSSSPSVQFYQQQGGDLVPLLPQPQTAIHVQCGDHGMTDSNEQEGKTVVNLN